MASSCNLKTGTHPRTLLRGVLYTALNMGWAGMCPTQARPAQDEAHRKHHELPADTQGSTVSCECSPWCTEQQDNSKGSADGHLGQGGCARCCISKAQHFALHRVKLSASIWVTFTGLISTHLFLKRLRSPGRYICIDTAQSVSLCCQLTEASWTEGNSDTTAPRRKNTVVFLIISGFSCQSLYFLQSRKALPVKKTQLGLHRADIGAFYKYPKSKWTPRILFDVNYESCQTFLWAHTHFSSLKKKWKETAMLRGAGCLPQAATWTSVIVHIQQWHRLQPRYKGGEGTSTESLVQLPNLTVGSSTGGALQGKLCPLHFKEIWKCLETFP